MLSQFFTVCGLFFACCSSGHYYMFFIVHLSCTISSLVNFYSVLQEISNSFYCLQQFLSLYKIMLTLVGKLTYAIGMNGSDIFTEILVTLLLIET